MPIEIEAKFPDIDRVALRRLLTQSGYACVHPEYLMRRVVFDLPQGDKHRWARVRDEAGVVTISYKRTHDINRVDGTEEIQIIADDFDTACHLLEAFGLIRKSYQETRREMWTRALVEVTLDEWPAIPPFAEIEAPDEGLVRAAAQELGFVWENALFGAVATLYERIGISSHAINAAPMITFDHVADIHALAQQG